ncbi:uncharacterized protein [Haliotis asinina]|uniref:uncharacterized protein n=1 Tax=Haliotis asinina TaxID=109174 RepID=UPI0035326E7C
MARIRKQKMLLAVCALVGTIVVVDLAITHGIQKGTKPNSLTHLLKHIGLDHAHHHVAQSKTTTRKEICPDVLSKMTTGHWVKRPLTILEQEKIDTFLSLVRRGQNFSRKDDRCGNTTIGGKREPRALCLESGPKPCCFEGHCRKMTVSQCQCRNCYDIRQQIHAEFAAWRPSDERCQPKLYSAKQACALLRNGTILVVGDSFQRHLFSALLIILRGNNTQGPLSKKTPAELLKKCLGMNAFGLKECRTYIDIHPGHSLCNGSVHVNFASHSHFQAKLGMLRYVKLAANQRRHLILGGIGIHDNANSALATTYIKPSLDLLKNKTSKWPLFMWSNIHSPGLTKSPYFIFQGSENIKAFNKAMTKLFKEHDVPVLDTFNLTQGVTSFDGTHYGLGVNLMKAQIFLNYIAEQEIRGRW